MKKIFLLIILVVSTNAFAMEEEEQQAGIEAKIFLFSERPRYAGFKKNWNICDPESKLQKALRRDLEPNELLFKVRVYNNESENFYIEGIKSLGIRAGEFPERLTFEELKDLTEGGSKILQLPGLKSGITFNLTANQSNHKTFERTLWGLLKVAQEKGPHYIPTDQSELIEAEILQKGIRRNNQAVVQLKSNGQPEVIGWEDQEGYTNGPKGFDFEAAFKELKDNK